MAGREETFPLYPVLFKYFDPVFEALEGPVQKLESTALSPLIEAANTLQGVLGLPNAEARYLAMFLLSFLFAAILRPLRGTYLRHFYVIAIGLLYGIFLNRTGIVHVFISSVPVYLLVLIAPNPTTTKICCVWAFSYMVIGHLHCMWMDYMGDRMDWTVPQLVLTLKLCAWACTLSDGHLRKDKKEKLQPYQLNNMVTRQPNPIEFFSYIFYFPTFAVGPFFEFNQYVSFIDRSMYSEYKGSMPPGCWSSLVKRMAPIVVCIFLVVNYGPLFSKEALIHIDQKEFWFRWVWLWAFMVCTRCSYYVGWLFSEGAAIVTGFSYNGKDAHGHPKWDRIQNVNIVGVEFSQTLYKTVDEWNKGTAYWLKHYVYLRGLPPGGRPAGSTFYLVYAVSSLWHGFYPGYYLFFLFFGFFQSAAGTMRRVFRPLFTKDDRGKEIDNYPAKYIWDFITFVASGISLNYLATSFVLLDLDHSIGVLKSFYFIPHIIAVSIFVLGKAGILRPRASHTPKPKTN